jgi:hypothetical protein
MSTETPSGSWASQRADSLRRYDGKWVAISGDGRRIVAAAESLCELDKMVVAAGEDPEQVGFERVDLSGPSIGGAEFH